jgi:hypothetical protein
MKMFGLETSLALLQLTDQLIALSGELCYFQLKFVQVRFHSLCLRAEEQRMYV